MVDACYNIVKSKNLTTKICRKMNNSAFSISIDVNKKRRKKEERGKKKKSMD